MKNSWWQRRRWEKQLKQLQSGALAEYYTPPTLEDSQRFSDCELLALDFETTGLSAKKDRVLSIGFTPIKNARIQIGKSEHYLIKHTDSIPSETVVIHHITEQEAAAGTPIEKIFPHVLEQLSGKILVAHYADIEVGFLQKIAQAVYGSTLPLCVLDTLQIAFSSRYKDAVHVPTGALNLFALREQYELPRYKAHNAMIDAVAAAELLLVQAEEMGGSDSVTLKQLRATWM